MKRQSNLSSATQQVNGSAEPGSVRAYSNNVLNHPFGLAWALAVSCEGSGEWRVGAREGSDALTCTIARQLHH